ncbi:MAG: hypothetical protein EBY24_20290, partial [Betaproteobacteria bacterium]|nr:hypothetical protein [Betaproteobacteria bacterium]
MPYLSLRVDLEGRDPAAAEDACFAAGALSVTLRLDPFALSWQDGQGRPLLADRNSSAYLHSPR